MTSPRYCVLPELSPNSCSQPSLLIHHYVFINNHVVHDHDVGAENHFLFDHDDYATARTSG